MAVNVRGGGGRQAHGGGRILCGKREAAGGIRGGGIEAHNPKPKLLIENKGSQRERASRMGSRKGKNQPGSLKGRGK